RETVQAAGRGLITRRIDTVRVMGRREAVELHEVMGAADAMPLRLREQCNAYAAALRLYEGREWASAATAFDAVAERFGDGAARAMAGRCVVFMERAPEAGWDGVWRLDSKQFDATEPVTEAVPPSYVRRAVRTACRPE